MNSTGFLRLLSLLAVLATRIAITGVAGFLLGCFETGKDSRVAGGDDYPNGVETLGKKAAQARADSADWNGFDSVPKSGPGLYDTITVPDTVPDTAKAGHGTPAPKRSALARRSVADTCLAGGLLGMACPVDTLVTKVIDTAEGTVAVVRTVIDGSGVTRRDSTVIVKPDPSKPGSAGGVSLVVRSAVSRDSSRIDTWKFADADGNGLLMPQAGVANKVAIETGVASPGGVLRQRTQVLAAGADLDFNARGDNKLLAATTATLLGRDTIDLVRFLDADGDSALIDFAKDSNLVDLIEARRFPVGASLVSVTRQVRIVAYGDSTKNFPIRYGERKVFRDGTILDIAAFGLGPDSALRAGMEARWTETRFPPASDSLEREVRAFRVRLGSVPGDFSANALLGWSVEETPRSANGRFSMDFACETPVADGLWSATGDVIAWLVRADGRLTFTGAATAAGMKGRVTAPGGESAAITYDLAGEIVPPQP